MSPSTKAATCITRISTTALFTGSMQARGTLASSPEMAPWVTAATAGPPPQRSSITRPALQWTRRATSISQPATSHRVRVVNAQTGIITTFAGTGNSGGSSPFGDGGPATQAAILWPDGLAFDSAGDLFITDVGLSRIRMVNAQTGIISTVVGGGTGGLGDGGLATQATLHSPHGIAFDASDNLYIADEGNALIRMVSS